MVTNLQVILSNQDVNNLDSFAQHIDKSASSAPMIVSDNTLDAVLNDNLEY
jgi:hypothetical protein